MSKREEKGQECPNCGRLFTPKANDQMFCCDECQEEYELTLDEDLAMGEDFL